MTYNPVYQKEPFIDFSSVTPDVSLESLNLNWREKDLPERKRTKHVHRLHPYLGKYIPQLVEIFLRKYQPHTVCDPFVGSGTTLVEASALGVNSIGVDVSPFNCLLSKVKTDWYDLDLLEKEVLDIVNRVELTCTHNLFNNKSVETETDNDYLKTWYASQALAELLTYREMIEDYSYQDLLKIILSRSARSARLTTHSDLDFPKEPVRQPYKCSKHGRICTPVEEALKFLKRYSLDTLRRIKEYQKIRTDANVEVICGDSRAIPLPSFDMVMTSPPYVGLIDYHEQHRYAYELLGIPRDNEKKEIGPAFRGRSQKAKKDYIEGVKDVLQNTRGSLEKNGVIVIVVHDKEGLYENLHTQLGFRHVETLKRHVNRRTGRRASDFYEQILIWKKDD